MREILFRGKNIDGGGWVEGFYTEASSLIAYPSFVIETHRADYQVEPETVGQYTGLKDKSGNMIFEGDIISVFQRGEEQYRFIVAFGECGGVKNVETPVGYVGFYVDAADEHTRDCMGFGMRNDILYWLEVYECNVIGNIHDNPELLEAKQEPGQ